MNWKQPPADPAKKWVSKSLELQILLSCNWGCHACFVGNTVVACVGGDKKISDVVEGDVVYSYDEESKEFVKRRVARTMSRTTEVIYKLDAGWRPTFVTGEHPILVKGRGWVQAADVKAGDIILHLSTSVRKKMDNPMKRADLKKRQSDRLQGIPVMKTEENKRKAREASTRRMLTNNPMKNPEVAVKGFLNRKDRGKKSKVEKFVERIGGRFGLQFVGDGGLVVANKIPDFVIDGTNKLIEVWAAARTEFFEKDQNWINERRLVFEEAGYEVLFLPVTPYPFDDEMGTCDGFGSLRPQRVEERRKEIERIEYKIAQFAYNGMKVHSVTKITRESNPKAWTRMAGKKDLPITVHNLEVEGTHTYVANAMVVHNCDQFSNLPSISWVRKATMSLAQVEAFATEMRSTNSYIGRVRLLGGEPTLHPQLPALARVLASLRAEEHLGAVEIITNGSHKDRIKDLGGLIDRTRVSGQKDKEKHHTANLAATPASLGYDGNMCSAPWHCGISLNYYGYFPCSTGAGLARLMDDMPRWQRLTLPQRPVLEEWPDLQSLCNQCYHGLRPEDKVKCGTDLYELNAPSKEMWGHLAPWLHSKPVPDDWKVYGQ